MKKIDLKSFLIGLLTSLLVLLLAFSLQNNKSRYQISAASQNKVFILDTYNGNIKRLHIEGRDYTSKSYMKGGEIFKEFHEEKEN